jgi:hypothetical protein
MQMKINSSPAGEGRGLFSGISRHICWVAPMLLFVSSACSEHDSVSRSRTWTPSPTIIAQLEANLTMPKDASPLQSYVRYFAGEVVGGRDIVVGIFVYDPEHAEIRVVGTNQMPKILDGGCDVIHLTYDVDQRKVLSLSCNGEA